MKNEFTGHASTDLAMQLFREGKLHECIGCAEKVVQAYPEDALAYTILGAAYSQAGDHGMAIGAFERALAWDDSVRSHFNLAKAYEASGRNKNAIEQYTEAVQKDPSHVQASQALERLATAAADADQDLYRPHLLIDDSDVSEAQEPPQAGVPEQSTKPTGSQPTQAPAAPDGAEPTRMTGATAVQSPPVDPVPQPAAPPRLPELSGLQSRALEAEAKIHESHVKMMKSGVAYGVIIGPFTMSALMLLMVMFTRVPPNLFGVIGAGIVFGGLVGLWIGYTSGDDTSGLLAGAVLGAVANGLMSITGGFIAVLAGAICGAIFGAMAGFLIGMMVERSIGQI